MKKSRQTRWFKMALIAMLGWGIACDSHPRLLAEEGAYPGLLRFLQLKPKSETPDLNSNASQTIPTQQLAPPLPEHSPFPLPNQPVATAPNPAPNYPAPNYPAPNDQALTAQPYGGPQSLPPPNANFAPAPLPSASLPPAPFQPAQFASTQSTPIPAYAPPAYATPDSARGLNTQGVGQAIAYSPNPGSPPAQQPGSTGGRDIIGASYQENTEQQVLEAIQSPSTPPPTPPAPSSILDNSLPSPNNMRPLSLSEPNEGQRIISTYADAEMYEEESSEDAEEVEAIPVDPNDIEGEEGSYLQVDDAEFYQLGLLGQACHSGAIWCSRAGIIGGVQGTFLAPTQDSMLSVEMIDMVNDTRMIEESDFGFGGGVRTWLGIQAENVGFRAVYWGYDNNHYQPDEGVNGIGTAGFSNNYFLGANTLDIEMFNNYCFGLSTVRASLGARYADMDRQAMIMGRGKVGDVGLLGIASSQANLEGWGVVAGLEGNIPLRPWFRDPSCGPGPCNFFWKVQGSGLAAETKAAAVTQVHVVPTSDLFATAYSRDEAFAAGDTTLLNGMLQLGLNYRIPLARCARPAFIDLMWAFEAQTWQTGEAAARSKSNAFLAGLYKGSEFGGGVEAKSNANPTDIGLYGFVFGASLNY